MDALIDLKFVCVEASFISGKEVYHKNRTPTKPIKHIYVLYFENILRNILNTKQLKLKIGIGLIILLILALFGVLLT